jgi:zinc transport system ATP-binding protein
VVETGRYGIRGVGRWLNAEDRKQVDEAMQKTGVASLKKNLFRTLSGGEQQRALLARALCAEPTILILDEPTASMDEKGAHEAMTLTLKVAQERNAAILMVNHFIDLVIEVSQQVVFLDRDRQIVQVGAPQEIFADRATRSSGGGA